MRTIAAQRLASAVMVSSVSCPQSGKPCRRSVFANSESSAATPLLLQALSIWQVIVVMFVSIPFCLPGEGRHGVWAMI